jgi:hypothetical protein
MLARGEIRRRWRGAVVLALFVGVVGGVVLATAAGARRSQTALVRFNAYSRPEDLSLLPGTTGYAPTPAQLDALRHVHDVTAIAVIRFFTLVPQGAAAVLGSGGGPGLGAAVDGAMGNLIDRARLISGRRANSAAIDEITIGESLSARLHLGVGGHIDAASYSLAQVQAAINGGRGGPPKSMLGPRVRLRIVGIVRRPFDLGDLGAHGAGEGIVVLTPAFNRAYVDRIGNLGVVVLVRTSRGAADVPSVATAARRIFRSSGGVSTQAVTSIGAKDAIDVLTLALWIFVAVAALAGVVTIGIVLTRGISQSGVDQATLRALGVTRSQRVLTSGPRVLLIAAGGALVAVLGAVAASPLLPIGVARRADPDVGVHFDWLILGLGIVAVIVVVVAITFLAALRSTRRSTLDATSEARRRTSSIVETAARAGLPPTATSGLRMALEPGHGATAVPVRSAYLGAVFGVLGVIAVLVFASSLNQLVVTPRLYGSTWDFQAADTNFNATAANDNCGPKDFGLAHVRGVGAIAAACEDDIQLGGHPVTGWAFTPVRGTIEPEIVEGRAPRGPREVALGSQTLQALGKGIGDSVQGQGPHGTVSYRIVGRVVTPDLNDPQPLADSAVFTDAGLSRIFDSNSSSNRYLVGRFTPGVDPAAVGRRIGTLRGLDHPAGNAVPAEVTRLRRIDWLPTALAALLGGLALLAVGHALVTAVRRRRRELALLKTLGFNRTQVRATVAWQATTLASVGLVIGIPAGLIIGQFVWRRVADGLGISTTAAIPALAVLITIPAVLVIVNLIALVPARAAANTRPAIALRAE